MKIVAFLIGVFAAGGIAVPLAIPLAIREHQCPARDLRACKDYWDSCLKYWNPKVNKGCVIDGCLKIHSAICNPQPEEGNGQCFTGCVNPRHLPQRSQFKNKGC
ncbi:hypothetical protein EJ06DRAFT_559887 [Trichodelitschia bisporula]|uniref:Uncharacterized protein n=1 Tax=Trichodelitschia bisporula TaxID=703511 RepID=A0A6G1HKC3_9PEZI|nr:hypothetical protein EJ06DRAFT_559887 [Trichodelitschia bisporula]